MNIDGTVLWAAFLSASSLVFLVFLLVSGRKTRVDTRLEELSGQEAMPSAQGTVSQIARSTLPRLGAPLIPKDEQERTRLQARLIHAGLYSRQALVLFLGVKMFLIVGPMLLGLTAGLLGLDSMSMCLIYGALGGIIGLTGPNFWLNWMKRRRQISFRRSLPDALDVLVICLEGGLSLGGALNRVAGELRSAHPLLASELNIVQREVHLGRSEGEALRQFGDRADLEEVRGLAAVITQAERFGAGLVKSLRVHAETLRNKRLQHAEEMAQKAAIKLLFPTVLCILPGVFIIILGPAMIQIFEMFSELKF